MKIIFLIILVKIIYSHDAHSHRCIHDEIQRNITIGIVNDGISYMKSRRNEFLKLEN
jgi:hypothetical protein